MGVFIKDQDQSNLNYSSWRQELLDWGRERGGTHFIWLDADEAFTTNFKDTYRDEILKLKPGQKLVMQWLCLWKSAHVYREDASIWSKLYKDFIFCDDKTSQFGTTKLHEGRTPGENNKNTWIKLDPQKGAVLHFQFVAFERFQVKQVFMKSREFTLGNTSARRLNYKYKDTLPDPYAKTVPVPTSWLTDMQGIDTIEDTGTAWYNTEILNYFEEKGVLFFEPLQIWHIKKYKDLFVEKIGREPRSKIYPTWIIVLNSLKNKLLHG